MRSLGISALQGGEVQFRWSDWLVAHGHEVQHIDGPGTARPHKLTAEACVVDRRVIMAVTGGLRFWMGDCGFSGIAKEQGTIGSGTLSIESSSHDRRHWH